MLPAAPGRLSTTTGLPQRSPSFCATSRAMMSTPPPGANPTSMRTGFAGYCAPAPSGASAAATAVSAAMRIFIALWYTLRNELDPDPDPARRAGGDEGLVRLRAGRGERAAREEVLAQGGRARVAPVEDIGDLREQAQPPLEAVVEAEIEQRVAGDLARGI